jgi:hypothetical protein
MKTMTRRDQLPILNKSVTIYLNYNHPLSMSLYSINHSQTRKRI